MREHPLVTYDPDADVVYVRLSNDVISHTTGLDDLRNIDYSAAGTVVGIEFICASDGIDLADIPFSHAVAEAIGSSGFDLPIFAS